MSRKQMMTSAAMFFDGNDLEAVPLSWLERVLELFGEYDLSSVLFNVGRTDYEDDDGYVFADGCGELILWGTKFSFCRAELIDALKSRLVSSLDLDSPRQNARDRDDARLIASVSSTYGMFYVGIEEDLISSPSVLMRLALRMTDNLPPIRYGFAYKSPIEDHPASYAAGHHHSSISDIFQMIRHRKDRDQRSKGQDELWTNELIDRKRHLSGMVRKAYPANLLSQSHIHKGGLLASEIGAFSEVSGGLWLWELREEEIPAAQEMLEVGGLLVAGRASRP